MKKITPFIFFVLMAIGVILLLQSKLSSSDQKNVSSTSEPIINLFEIGDSPTAYGFIELTSVEHYKSDGYFQALIDFDDLGTFSFDDWVVRNYLLDSATDSPIRISFTAKDNFTPNVADDYKLWVATTAQVIGLSNDIRDGEGRVFKVSPVISSANSLVSSLDNFLEPASNSDYFKPDIDLLSEVLSEDVELKLRLRMLRSQSGLPDKEHFVSIRSLQQIADQNFIDIIDTLTPAGTDLLGISMTAGDSPYILVNYPLWDGIVVVDSATIARDEE